MDRGPKIVQVAAFVGDPARANMLSALSGGAMGSIPNARALS